MNGKILVVSLGGSPEPVILSIVHHQADKVIFFASELSGRQVEEIIDRAGFAGTYEVVCVPIPNDLFACLHEAEQLFAGLKEDSDRVVVDITGGTKVMVAALARAAIGFYRFSYVGGTVRQKGGLGAVSGGEQVWEFYLKS